MDLALDTVTHDLAIERGDLALVRGRDAIAQDIATRLQFFQGEWFLDQRVGMPYFKEVLVKNPDLGAVRFVIRSAILSTPGVRSLESFSLTFDGATRALNVTFTAKTVDDEVLDFSRELILA